MKNYKTLIISIAAAVLFILMIIFAVKGTENRAIGLEENVQTTQSDIDVQIDRRFNVLTELAECVKQYDKHEYETLKDVIESRGKNMSVTQADEVMAEINAVAEAYPELKSIMGRPVWTHELADKNIVDQIKEKSKADFIELCRIAAEEEVRNDSN